MPSDFGLMAMVLVVVRFGNTVSDMGLSNAIIQKDDVSSEQLSTLFWINISTGVSIFILIFVLRNTICVFYNEFRLFNVLGYSSVVFLILPAGQFFRSLLLKKLHFKIVSFVNILAYTCISLLTVCLAYLDFGVYALVFGYLVGEFIRTIALYFSSIKIWSPQLVFCLDNISKFVKFGIYNTGDKLANFFNVYLIDFLIGAYLGSTALGYYALSFNIVMRPIFVINTISSRVAFPILSSVKKEIYKVKSGYMKIVCISSLICFPVVIGIGLTAPQLIYVIYGSQWAPCILIVQILSLTAIVRSIGSTVGFLLLSQGRPDVGFKWSLVCVSFQVVGLYIAVYRYDIVGICIVLLALQCCFTILVYPLLIRPIIGPCFKTYIYNLFPATWASFFMTVAVYFVTLTVIDHIPMLYVLVLQIFIGAAVYIPTALYLSRTLVNEIKSLMFLFCDPDSFI